MARLLRDKDYLNVTLSDNLREEIEDNYNQWLDAEQVAQQEIYSKLKQRYIMDQVLTNTTVFDPTLIYKAKNLVEYTEALWNENTSYTVGQRVKYTGNSEEETTKIYQCIQASQGNVPTNATYWLYITDDLSLYYVTLPSDEWNNITSYIAGNTVWFLDKIYTCLQPNKNVLPTDSTQIWGTGTLYSITNKNPDIIYHNEIAYTVGVKVVYEDVLYTCILNSTGNLPTNTTYFTASTTRPYWTKGDNRNPLLKRFLLDMARYHFERAFPARNISDQLKIAYDGNDPNQNGGAIGWLKRVGAGKDNADLPEIIPTQGLAFSYGSTIKSEDQQLW